MYTKTTKTSYGQRLSGSFKKILTGFLLFFIATAMLFWNEGNYVKEKKAIGEAQSLTRSVSDVSINDGEYNGRLIHATAFAKTADTLVDNQFGFRVGAISLSRNVEFYQYEESSSTQRRDVVGGAQEEVTTYSYNKKWVSRPINSGSFADPNYQRSNFVLADVETMSQYADYVSFGAYRLPPFMVRDIRGNVSVNEILSEERIKHWEGVISNRGFTSKVSQSGNVVYFGKSAGQPEVGDVKVTFTHIPPSKEISIIGKVNHNTFEPFVAKNGRSFYKVSSGLVSAPQMFEAAHEANRIFTWILRITGVILVVVGLRAIFEFLPTLFKVIPFLSKIVNIGIAIVCTVVGISWSLLIISLSWLFYRPLIGAPLLLLSIAGIWYLKKRGDKTPPAPIPVETQLNEA